MLESAHHRTLIRILVAKNKFEFYSKRYFENYILLTKYFQSRNSIYSMIFFLELFYSKSRWSSSKLFKIDFPLSTCEAENVNTVGVVTLRKNRYGERYKQYERSNRNSCAVNYT
jgi:hypothetical protein